jgi:hypothetical protein
MRTTPLNALAAAAIALAVAMAPAGAIADQSEGGDTVTNCNSITLDPEESRTYTRSFADNGSGLVIVEGDDTRYSLYVLNANNEVVCDSVGADTEKQSCIWVADGSQTYKAKVVNNRPVRGSNGDDEDDDGDDQHDNRDISVEVCFVDEE